MTRKIPLTIALAALVGLAAPALAAEHGAKHDPQVATTAAKGHEKAGPAKKETKASHVKGRKAAKAKKASKEAAKPAAPAQAAPAAPAPAK